MLKRWFLLTSLLTISATLTSGFVKPKSELSLDWFENDKSAYIVHYAPTEKQLEYIHFNFPYAGKTITGFRQAIAYRESNGKLNSINTLGCVGKYQFERNTLKSIGVKNVTQFLKNPTLQEKAFLALLSKNKWELRKEIKRFEGRVIGGVLVTESGILAAAHLGGVGATKKFLRSNGRSAYTDGYGTSMKVYIKKFGGYDTSAIPATLNATIN